MASDVDHGSRRSTPSPRLDVDHVLPATARSPTFATSRHRRPCCSRGSRWSPRRSPKGWSRNRRSNAATCATATRRPRPEYMMEYIHKHNAGSSGTSSARRRVVGTTTSISTPHRETPERRLPARSGGLHRPIRRGRAVTRRVRGRVRRALYRCVESNRPSASGEARSTPHLVRRWTEIMLASSTCPSTGMSRRSSRQRPRLPVKLGLEVDFEPGTMRPSRTSCALSLDTSSAPVTDRRVVVMRTSGPRARATRRSTRLRRTSTATALAEHRHGRRLGHTT